MNEDQNEFIKFHIEDGILFSEFSESTVIDLEKAKKIISLREKISDGNNQYWCYNILGMNSMNIDARNYADKHGQNLLSACAVIVHTPVSQFIFNIFLRLKSPDIPFRSFTSKESAVKWLKKIKSENERR